MKIFDRDGKYNFVDNNNVFVGFCSSQCCCESFGWFVADKACSSLNDEPKNEVSIRGYDFDIEFFQTADSSTDNTDGYSPFDEGGMAIFRLTNRKGKERFLHLYNCHNGYYAHGFTVKHNGEVIRIEYL